MYVALSGFLLRAPLLRENALARARVALERHALGALAVGLASEGAAAATGAARARAWDRYGRRAAFRATPQGLLAGACVGRLAAATDIETVEGRAWLAPTWRRLAGLGRSLLDEEPTRDDVRVRCAPSVMRDATTARWLADAPGDGWCEERAVALDARLSAILDATTAWTAWPAARRAARRRADAREAIDEAGDEDADDFLLALVDEGLLATDVTPPLVGAAPSAWTRARLARGGRRDDARTLARAVAALASGDPVRGAALLETLPGASTITAAAAIHGTLVHECRRPPTLARAAIERAAALAPLLFRLQDALAPPASERLAQPALDEALGGLVETFGAGALDVEELATGGYGVDLADAARADDEAARPTSDVAVLAALVDAALAAARAGDDVARLDVDALTTLVGGIGPAAPPSCELFLTPARLTRGAPEGTGWLLGLHAPAGSTWGRFEGALGAPMARALDALADAERAARPTQETLDVAFAPSAALADLAVHPRTRRRVLAISGWSDGDAATTRDLAPRDLELVADPAAAAPLALRERATRAPVAPSPLARVRSTTAPGGVTRLLCGWSLHRQHAPWALPLGPLSALAHVPRFVLDGFVVAPATWRLPPGATGAELRRWRRARGVPRWVQVGHEDQLLPVDLDAPEASRDLGGHERVWEIWPPLGRAVDRGGRRVEAVVALVRHPEADEADADARADRATAAAGRVPPPRAAGPARGWLTFKIFGVPDHQDAILSESVLPAIAAARRAREISRWFFQRYVEGPGGRHHLRVRVHAARANGRAAFASRLDAALAPARAAGAVVSVDVAEYHPERARFGDALDAVHEIFQSDSVLVGAIVDAERAAPESADDPRVVALVRSLDALARGLGLDLETRRRLARARRDAEASSSNVAPDEFDAEFRARSRALRVAVGGVAARGDRLTRALRAHEGRTARATKSLPQTTRVALAPALLHLACVRLAGADRGLEHRAYMLWERTLEGLARAPVAVPPVPARGP